MLMSSPVHFSATLNVLLIKKKVREKGYKIFSKFILAVVSLENDLCKYVVCICMLTWIIFAFLLLSRFYYLC